jgi:7,8-dihydropterin-6-yl-methyl-4-(beta-D-ribofuranosyl)aminobenzene 5'-phosphate synthase
MCTEAAAAGDVRAAMPHPVVGSAADPIALEPVDDVVVTTLVDNVYDALLTSDDTITRAPLAAGTAQAPQFEPGRTNVGLMAEHGFSALVTVRRGDTTTSVLFDTGLSRMVRRVPRGCVIARLDINGIPDMRHRDRGLLTSFHGRRWRHGRPQPAEGRYLRRRLLRGQRDGCHRNRTRRYIR